MSAAYAGAGMDQMMLDAKMDLVVAMNRKKAALYKMKSGMMDVNFVSIASCFTWI